jgi:hypothetical protein
MVTSTETSQGLLLRTEYFGLDWTLRFTRPNVLLDGALFRVPWGEKLFPLEPGFHDLQVFYPYLRLSRAGNSRAQFDVKADHLVRATYQAPSSVLLAFRPGKLTIG